MAAVPSQRRGLPQPYASQGQQKENTPQLALSNRPDGTTAAAAVTVTIETSEHSKRASPAASMPVTTAVAAGGLAGTAPAFRQPANGSPAPNPQRGTQSRGGKSPYARPAAATFPWSSRPDPAVVAHGPSYPEKQFNVGAGVQQPPHHHHSHHFSAGRATGSERAATPDSQRRGFVAHANVKEMLHHSPPPQQQQQQRLASSSSPYAEPSIHDATPPQQQPGTSSSLVFALSEDSELQVLASRVGPTKPAGTAPRTSDGTAAAATQPSLAVSRAGQLPAAGVTSAAAAAAAHHHLPLPPHATPHTPGVYRSLSERTADEAQAVAGSKPSVQVAYPPSHVSSSNTSTAPSSSAAAKPTAGAGAAMLYRSTPHDLPSPPALHVCPGAIPGSAAGQPGPTRATSSDSRAAPLPAAAAGAVSSGAAARWSASGGGVPSVSLYAAYATGHPPPPPPRHYAASAGPEGSGGRGGRLSTARSVDGRSQHSGTPPPPPSSSSAAALAAGRPVEKNFTKAQQEAVLAEVQQELFLNYTAVPVPAHMVNSGDTDERRRRLEQRQKQILYGKETDGYATYTTMVPRPCDREYHNPLHAITPRPEYDCSKRQFDRVLNAWRRQLHQWDECDLNQPEARFLPGGHATLLDLGLMAETPAAHTPTPGDQQQQQTLPQQPQQQQQQQQPSGVMHSIANVAAMAHDQHHNARDGDAAGGDDGDDEDGVSHTRSPVFTGHTPTSGLYSNSLSMHLNSGRASAMTAAACTPSRPQLSEGGEGPQVDDSFFLHMNSANSRIASPYHPNYSGHGHPNAHASSAAAAAAAAHGLPSGAPNGSHHHHHGNGVASGGATPFHAYGGGAMGAAVPANGRSSANSYYHQFMRNNSYAHHTGLTPAHRPPSRGAMPHHISAIFGSEFELMTPSGPGSPSGIPPIPRNGGSPYRLSEPWMPPPNRRSPTYQVAGAHSGAGTAAAAAVPSGIAAANSAGTMMLTGARGGESPPQTTELALIPSTSHSSGSGGFAQSPYGFRVHSPVQPQAAYATPVSRPQSRPGMAAAQPLSLSPSRSPIGLLSPQQQQEQRVAVATTTRSQRGSGVAAVPTSWTPPNTQVHVRPSPRTPQLHLAATPPSTKRPEGQ